MENVRGYYGIVERDKVWIRYRLRDNRAAERFWKKPAGGGNVIAVGYRGERFNDILLNSWTLNKPDTLHSWNIEYHDIPAWARAIAKH
jgi:hypothetical protein